MVSHLALTGRFPLAENFRETGFFIPAALDDAEQQCGAGLATAAIEALGVRTGCLHTEVKFTPDGPRIIEVNGRVGGGVPEMLDRAAGIPLLELTLRVALGEEIRIDGPVATERIGYRFFLQPPAVSATVAAIRVSSGERPSGGGHDQRAPGARRRSRLAGRVAEPHHGRRRLGRLTTPSCRRSTGCFTKR